MPNLEIEYKTMLTKDEYRRLEIQMQSVKPITQTNYYIDSDDFIMKSNRMSLRIRTLSNRAELTLKIPQEVGNHEYNIPLDVDVARGLTKNFSLPDGLIKDILNLKEIPLEHLKIIGHLTTIRREMHTPIGLMALDYNQYAHIKDYELELEVSDSEKGKEDFDDFLNEHNISYKFAKSKVARFSATLKKS